MAQFGEKIWFHEGISSFVKCIIQGVFVGHHNRTIGISYITKSGIVRGKSRTKQTLSDALEATKGSHTVITETRLTKKFIFDEGGAGPLCQECWSRILQRLSVADSTFCLRILKLTDTLEVVQDTHCLNRMEK